MNGRSSPARKKTFCLPSDNDWDNTPPLSPSSSILQLPKGAQESQEEPAHTKVCRNSSLVWTGEYHGNDAIPSDWQKGLRDYIPKTQEPMPTRTRLIPVSSCDSQPSINVAFGDKTERLERYVAEKAFESLQYGSGMKWAAYYGHHNHSSEPASFLTGIAPQLTPSRGFEASLRNYPALTKAESSCADREKLSAKLHIQRLVAARKDAARQNTADAEDIGIASTLTSDAIIPFQSCTLNLDEINTTDIFNQQNGNANSGEGLLFDKEKGNGKVDLDHTHSHSPGDILGQCQQLLRSMKSEIQASWLQNI